MVLKPPTDMFKIRGIWWPKKLQLKIINKWYASFLTKPWWQNRDQMFIIKNCQQQGNCQKVKEVVVPSKNDQDLKEDLIKTNQKKKNMTIHHVFCSWIHSYRCLIQPPIYSELTTFFISVLHFFVEVFCLYSFSSALSFNE